MPTDTPAPQADPELLATIDAKIIHHRDVTGRMGRVRGFEAARAGLTGEISASEALAAIKSNWRDDLWKRIRKILKGMRD